MKFMHTNNYLTTALLLSLSRSRTSMNTIHIFLCIGNANEHGEAFASIYLKQPFLIFINNNSKEIHTRVLVSLSRSRTSMSTSSPENIQSNPRGIFWNDRDKTHRAADGSPGPAAAALTVQSAHACTVIANHKPEFGSRDLFRPIRAEDCGVRKFWLKGILKSTGILTTDRKESFNCWFLWFYSTFLLIMLARK